MFLDGKLTKYSLILGVLSQVAKIVYLPAAPVLDALTAICAGGAGWGIKRKLPPKGG